MRKPLLRRLFPRREVPDPRAELMDSLKETRRALNRAYDGFNRAGDPDLIESYVFEINSLQSRYTYLLRKVRQGTPTAALRE